MLMDNIRVVNDTYKKYRRRYLQKSIGDTDTDTDTLTQMYRHRYRYFDTDTFMKKLYQPQYHYT